MYERECGFNPDYSRSIDDFSKCHGPTKDGLLSFIQGQLTTKLTERSSATNLLYDLAEAKIISEEDVDKVLNTANDAWGIDINNCFRKVEDGIRSGRTFDIDQYLLKLEEYHDNGFNVPDARLKNLCKEIIVFYTGTEENEYSLLSEYEPSKLLECARRLFRNL